MKLKQMLTLTFKFTDLDMVIVDDVEHSKDRGCLSAIVECIQRWHRAVVSRRRFSGGIPMEVWTEPLLDDDNYEVHFEEDNNTNGDVTELSGFY
jgi:hypothetical protein